MANTSFAYRWKAVNPEDSIDLNGDTKFVTGEMNAPSEEIVSATLSSEMGLRPVSIDKKKQLGGDKEWSIAKILGKPSGKSMAEAYRQLSSLVKAGVPLPEAVAAVAEGSGELMIRETFGELRDEVTQGVPLNKAMESHPKVFDDIVIQLVGAAIEGGFVAETLLRIADMAENKNKVKKKIRGALMMPVITVIAAIGVGIMMSIVLVPQLAQMLEDMNPGEPLPALTQGLMWVSENAIIIALILIALAVGWFFLNRKVLRYKEGWHEFKSKAALKTPVFGKLARLSALATLSRSMEMMIHAGVQQSEALTIIAPSMTNRLYRRATADMATAVVEGRKLSTVMVNYPGLFDFAFIKMVQTGEDAGSLDEMLENVANQKEDDVDDMTDNMAALLNPLALMVVGVLLGALALSMFGPILSIASSL